MWCPFLVWTIHFWFIYLTSQRNSLLAFLCPLMVVMEWYFSIHNIIIIIIIMARVASLGSSYVLVEIQKITPGLYWCHFCEGLIYQAFNVVQTPECFSETPLLLTWKLIEMT
jgi:hypothetical protein